MIYQKILPPQFKMFKDDASLFSVVNDPTISAYELNKDLELISEWAYKWKMTFNPARINRHKKLFSHENNLNQNTLNYHLIRHLWLILPFRSFLE